MKIKMDLLRWTLVVVLCSCLTLLTLAQYTPDWSSLDKRPIPQWYLDSKFGKKKKTKK
jgi:hypothetical protein